MSCVTLVIILAAGIELYTLVRKASKRKHGRLGEWPVHREYFLTSPVSVLHSKGCLELLELHVQYILLVLRSWALTNEPQRIRPQAREVCPRSAYSREQKRPGWPEAFGM